MLEPSWSSPGDLPEPSCSPPGGPFGGLLGASQGVSETPQGPDDGIPLKTYAVLPHGHLFNTFVISFHDFDFILIKKNWGGGVAPLGQSVILIIAHF